MREDFVILFPEDNDREGVSKTYFWSYLQEKRLIKLLAEDRINFNQFNAEICPKCRNRNVEKEGVDMTIIMEEMKFIFIWFFQCLECGHEFERQNDFEENIIEN